MALETKKLQLQGVPVEFQNKLTSFIAVQDEESAMLKQKRVLTNQEVLEELAKQKVIQQNMLEIGKNGKSVGDSLSYLSPQNNNSSIKSHNLNLGFNCSAPRFPDSLSDVFSPVAYQSVESKPSPNFNKKGLGNGFVSKSLRFSHGMYPNHGPGPGAYFKVNEHENSFKNILEDIPISYQHPKIKKRPIVRPVKKGDNFPGPGNYFVKDDIQRRSGPTYKSVFQSASSRNILAKTIENTELELTNEQFQVARSLEHKKPGYKMESSSFANPVVVQKPNHFYEPLVNLTVHQTNTDIFHLLPTLKSLSPKREKLPKESVHQPLLNYAKKPIKIIEKPIEKPKEDKQKDPFFGSQFKIPRIHSLELNV